MQTEKKASVDQITDVNGGRVNVLRFSGDISSSSHDALLGTYETVSKSEPVLLDFSKVDYINSSGIALADIPGPGGVIEHLAISSDKLGNIYVVEALHRARLLPHRQASTIATASGLPRPAAYRLTAAIKQVLIEAIDRVSKGAYRSSRFRVYDREGQRCRRARCGGIIKRRTQAGRSTFYCPVCQK